MILPHLRQCSEKQGPFIGLLRRVVASACRERRHDLFARQAVEVLVDESTDAVVEHLATFGKNDVVGKAMVLFKGKPEGIVSVYLADVRGELLPDIID
jgi:hypothetical protein